MQCDIVQCKGKCSNEDPCTSIASFTKGGKNGNEVTDGMGLAATTVYVLDPADAPCKFSFESGITTQKLTSE